MRHLLFVIVPLSLLAAACTEPQPAVACKEGETRACYSGPEGTVGKGVCREGVATCVNGTWSGCDGEVTPGLEICGDGIDNDCNGLDDGERNACGGCKGLTGTPGTPCDGCGTWKCDGKEAVVCTAPTTKPGTACNSTDGCTGTNVCDAESGKVVCNAPAKNACGKCGGPVLTGRGDNCTTLQGCSGKLVCNTAGDALLCEGPPKNNCGICGEPNVADVGGSCLAQNGCAGIRVCNALGNGTNCQAT
ncbi:MAG: hypothetical protein ACK4N5_21850, partial [Myxococcales bacterium]